MPQGWLPVKEVSEESSASKLSEEAVHAATSDFYLGDALRLAREQKAFEESWADFCKAQETSQKREIEEANCISLIKESRRLRKRRQRRSDSPLRVVWGDRLLYDPVAQNDCFFEAVSRGLEEASSGERVMPKRLRNLVSAEHKKGPPDLLCKIAGAEGKTPAAYCKALRRSLWGGAPEAGIIAQKYKVMIKTWSGDKRLPFLR